MVKEIKTQDVQEVCLDPRKPCARTYEWPNKDEQVTIPDVAPSLYQMVMSGTVGSMPGNSTMYQYPDLGEDDDAHDHPDYEKLDKIDQVEKEMFAENWLQNPKNYEQKDVSTKANPETKVEGEEASKTETAPVE